MLTGLIIGIPGLALAGPLHFLLQYGLRVLIVRLKRPLSHRMEALVLNVPALALLAFLLAQAALPSSPAELRSTFLKWLGGAQSDAVAVKGYGWTRGLNEGDVFMVFSLNPGELQSLLATNGFAVEIPELDEFAMRSYERLALKVTKGAPAFKPPGSLYVVRSDRLRKELIVSSNRQDVLFHGSWW